MFIDNNHYFHFFWCVDDADDYWVIAYDEGEKESRGYDVVMVVVMLSKKVIMITEWDEEKSDLK